MMPTSPMWVIRNLLESPGLLGTIGIHIDLCITNIKLMSSIITYYMSIGL